MKHTLLGSTHVLLLLSGEKIIETIKVFCVQNKITAATLQAIGAVREVELGFYKLGEKKYAWKKTKAELEIDGLLGNIALLNNDVIVHAHMTVSDSEMHAFGGHLKEAVVGASCEIFLTPLPGTLERRQDESTGLNLLQLP